jgi:hypothetical protein
MQIENFTLLKPEVTTAEDENVWASQHPVFDDFCHDYDINRNDWDNNSDDRRDPFQQGFARGTETWCDRTVPIVEQGFHNLFEEFLAWLEVFDEHAAAVIRRLPKRVLDFIRGFFRALQEASTPCFCEQCTRDRQETLRLRRWFRRFRGTSK